MKHFTFVTHCIFITLTALLYRALLVSVSWFYIWSWPDLSNPKYTDYFWSH